MDITDICMTVYKHDFLSIYFPFWFLFSRFLSFHIQENGWLVCSNADSHIPTSLYIRKNTLSLERPRKYPKGCPNTT